MKSAENKMKYHDIILTDVKFHTILQRKPLSWYRAMWLSVKNGVARRAYSNDIKLRRDNSFGLYFHNSPEIKVEREKAERQGEILRIFMPKAGLPVFLGEDIIERLRAVDKKLEQNIRTEYY